MENSRLYACMVYKDLPKELKSLVLILVEDHLFFTEDSSMNDVDCVRTEGVYIKPSGNYSEDLLEDWDFSGVYAVEACYQGRDLLTHELLVLNKYFHRELIAITQDMYYY
jgi:hypothetical protein